MTYAVYRMNLFRCLTEPMHIAFKTNRGRTAHHQHGRHNSRASTEDKPPPGWRSYGGRIHAAVHKAADPVLWHKIGRFSFACRHFVRCRGPPFGLNFKNSD